MIFDAPTSSFGENKSSEFLNLIFETNNQKILFVCRYPQSNDLIKWLQSIPNRYLHFGDLDFAGINIYLNEFKKYLG